MQPRWVDLEDRIEQFLIGAGYGCRRNPVVTGRSGVAHEVDVLAERSDAVSRYRVAVECKAWNRPVEKEAVAKLAFVVADIGADKGILVALSGGRSGAARSAEDLGIDLWGPSEIEDRLGPPALSALSAAPAVSAWPAPAVPLRCGAERARWLVDGQARGRFGLRGEQVGWVRPVWVAQHRVVVATTGEGRAFLGRRASRSHVVANLYDGLTGAWWRSFDGVPETPEVAMTARVPPAVPAGRVAAMIRRAQARRDASASPAARDRWSAALEALGVPGDAASVSVEATETLYWPFWLGLLTGRRGGGSRLVAVDGSVASAAVCPVASEACTAGMGHILRSVGVA